MIILATAIILSLSNSGIIGKANKAKTDSDTANLKEYVNTLRAEWELMTAEEQAATASSFEAYANKKIEDNGYKGAVGVDGEVYSNLNDNARAAIVAGIKVGDAVTGYTVEAKTYETSGEENTAPNNIETNLTPQTIVTNTQITWKYLGVNTDGKIEMVADFGAAVAEDDSKIKLSGKGGYLKGPQMLNLVCKVLYSVEEMGQARSMNIDDVNNILGYTGERGAYWNTSRNYVITQGIMTVGELETLFGKKLSNRTRLEEKDISSYYSDYYKIDKVGDINEMKKTENIEVVYNTSNKYWLASSCTFVRFNNSAISFCVRYVNTNLVNAQNVFDSDDESHCFTFAIRPVVRLEPSVTLTKDTTAENTWKIN